PRGWRSWRCLARLLLAALLLVLAAGAWALDPGKPYRDYMVDTWGVEKGLPQITVMAIAQDADGYLWIGTQAGLARFDGVQFRRFERGDVLNLDSMIQALLADPQGRLWIGTAKGLLVLEHGRIRPLSAPAGIAHFPVGSLALPEGRLVVGGPDGLYVPDGQGLRRLRALPGPVTSLLADGRVLWVGGPGQVLRICAPTAKMMVDTAERTTTADDTAPPNAGGPCPRNSHASPRPPPPPWPSQGWSSQALPHARPSRTRAPRRRHRACRRRTGRRPRCIRRVERPRRSRSRAARAPSTSISPARTASTPSPWTSA
ncbi:MAG: hypothetical protein J0I18_12490, partial [Actinobacteria bacterium]|nr:hypothetical protein [Actinomycetota bacterium]